MMHATRAEDQALAEIWMAHFGAPMPIYGVPSITKRVLREHGVDVDAQLTAKLKRTEKTAA